MSLYMAAQFAKNNTELSTSDKFFGIFAKSKSFAIIALVMLQNYDDNKMNSLLSAIPIPKSLFIGNFVIDKALKWLKEQLKNNGEAYIMEKFVKYWKNNNITEDDLVIGISSNPLSNFDVDAKAFQLLYKYYK